MSNLSRVSPRSCETRRSRSFYADGLGLAFEGQEGDYVFTHELEGTRHFGLWPLTEAANACFGTAEWPAEVRAPRPASSSKSLTSPRQQLNSAPRATSSSTVPARNRGVKSPLGC